MSTPRSLPVGRPAYTHGRTIPIPTGIVVTGRLQSDPASRKMTAHCPARTIADLAAVGLRHPGGSPASLAGDLRGPVRPSVGFGFGWLGWFCRYAGWLPG